MKKWLVLGTMLICGWVWAQQGGGTIPPEVRARMEAFRKFRDQHKYTFQLMGLVRGIMNLEKEGKPLNAKQAKQLLSILQPLTKKQKLTQDEARKTQFALQKTLTAAQLNTISRLNAEMRRRTGQGQGGNRPGFGGGGGAGGGAPGGGGSRPPGGGPPGGSAGRPGGMARMDPAKMKDFNPFNLSAKSDSPMTQRLQGELKQFMAALAKKAKG